MRTRGGVCYQIRSEQIINKKRNFSRFDFEEQVPFKRLKTSPEITAKYDLLDVLPDELIICILSKLISSADSTSDFFNILLTSKRLNSLAFTDEVLSKASTNCLAVKSDNWSESAHLFLKQCSIAGNLEACYILGMIRFYCLENRGSGASLMAKAAMKSHAQALYSLSVIQFNGSGGTKNDKDLRAGVALCSRAAYLGNIDALRELGHCLQDGYGVSQNITEGRKFLIHANAREVASLLLDISSFPSLTWQSSNRNGTCGPRIGCPLLSDFGCNVPAPEIHPANRFLVEWFATRRNDLESQSGLRLCSYSGCGRPETRRHEFRRCSVCGTVNYCSRACQALDWKLRHKVNCIPMAHEGEVDGEVNNGVNVNFDGDIVGVQEENENDEVLEEIETDEVMEETEKDEVLEEIEKDEVLEKIENDEVLEI